MKQIKLKVGKTYRNRKGEKVKIVRKDWCRYPYYGSDGEWYTESGGFSYSTETPYDLIEEVEAPTATRHTFAIPEGVKEITLDYFGNRIVVEMVPEKEPKPGDVMINKKRGSLSIVIFIATVKATRARELEDLEVTSSVIVLLSLSLLILSLTALTTLYLVST